jgi:hypothetical protein
VSSARVIAGAAIVLRRPPLGVDQSLAVEAVQGLIQRRILDGELAVRPLAHQGGDAVAVDRAERDGPENDQVEGSLQQG